MGKAAKGTLFKVASAGAPSTHVTVGEVTDISGPGLSADVHDVTNMDSTYAEKVVGLLDGGEVSLSMNFLPTNTQHKSALADLASGALRSMQIVWIDGPTTWSFSGFVTKYEPSASVGGKLGASMTVKISGAVTLP